MKTKVYLASSERKSLMHRTAERYLVRAGRKRANPNFIILSCRSGLNLLIRCMSHEPLIRSSIQDHSELQLVCVALGSLCLR